MSESSVRESPSKTAAFAALHRALAHRAHHAAPFGLAEFFLPPPQRVAIRFAFLRRMIRRKMARILPGLHTYMMARTAFFDQQFARALAEQTPQIVLLGAGYDTRAFRFAKQNRTSRIFELDIATTQQRKRDCLKRAMLDIPSWLILAPIDFDRDSMADVLAAVGYDPAAPTAFLWEGVCYYLEPAAVDTTLAFVREQAGPGSVLAFEYATATSAAAAGDAYGVREFFAMMQSDHAGERFKFALADEDVAAFLAARGFSLVQSLDARQIERTFLDAGGGTPLGRVTGHFRFAVAAPDQAPRRG